MDMANPPRLHPMNCRCRICPAAVPDMSAEVRALFAGAAVGLAVCIVLAAIRFAPALYILLRQ